MLIITVRYRAFRNKDLGWNGTEGSSMHPNSEEESPRELLTQPIPQGSRPDYSL